MKTGWAGCMTRHQRMTQSLADLKAVRGAILTMVIAAALASHTCLTLSTTVLQLLCTAGLHIGLQLGYDMKIKERLACQC